jgi:hypothetical protein
VSEGAADLPAGPGGGYITRGRALELERHIARVEERWEERFAHLEAEVHAARAMNLDLLRAQLSALMEVLRNEIGGTTPASAATPLHRQTGGR